jgi:hypothetical protein
MMQGRNPATTPLPPYCRPDCRTSDVPLQGIGRPSCNLRFPRVTGPRSLVDRVVDTEIGGVERAKVALAMRLRPQDPQTSAQ